MNLSRRKIERVLNISLCSYMHVTLYSINEYSITRHLAGLPNYMLNQYIVELEDNFVPLT